MNSEVDLLVSHFSVTCAIYKRQASLNYHKAWNKMTEESSNNESTSPEKLLIDNPSDFQFHAAYLTYSDTYDKTANPENKKAAKPEHQGSSTKSNRLLNLLQKHKSIPNRRRLPTHPRSNSHKNTEKTRMAQKNAKTRKNRAAQKITARTNGRKASPATKVKCFYG
jgi:hypothetical protein